MQGTICDNTTPKSPKGFHDIYSNTAFNFEYPTTANALFPVLWDIVYFLLTQLYFLKRQCKFDLGNACGWYYCKYGKGINTNGTADATSLKSWICQQTDAADHTSNCGSTKPSPLQAFLCDCLTGFRCQYIEDNKCQIQNGQLVPTNGVTPVPYSDHVSHRQFHLYCPVPMGFNKELLPQNGRTGNYLKEILDYFTQKDRDSVSCYNITLCLLIVCKRTPRTVGDLFAFFLYLDENMETDGVDTEIQQKMNDFTVVCYTESQTFTNALNKLGEDHPDDHNDVATLHTLRDSECTTPRTCGKYLDPLSFVIYCNVSVAFAETYLKWIIYLAEVLYDGLKQLQKDFQKRKCDHDKQNKCPDGCHGEKDKCLCPTIVQCAEVLPLFFKFGFTFSMADALNGKYKSKPDWLRQCKGFSTQLQNVIINGGLFKILLDEINKFLTCIRKPFLYYLLTFWLIAILYFSYGLTIPLDLLHIRSHLRPALSHQISVLALLSHKAMAPTKVGYFTP
ncbi:uncharacterized protein BXIN_2431 [Babesia sp. Xinjiang]|uniref:uncharacterized protein n=1 Tax=Babesia sp. Xinjiang TaxID=462227 RepID=UPI000A252DDC|nr:uncharacterized protein BXIN_2431 [Babesia sp. Xinjiang]ORM40234.1 hypothetical protein BXIN_2431 [Babesia sp. Xinjiang]